MGNEYSISLGDMVDNPLEVWTLRTPFPEYATIVTLLFIHQE